MSFGCWCIRSANEYSTHDAGSNEMINPYYWRLCATYFFMESWAHFRHPARPVTARDVYGRLAWCCLSIRHRQQVMLNNSFLRRIILNDSICIPIHQHPCCSDMLNGTFSLSPGTCVKKKAHVDSNNIDLFGGRTHLLK